MKPFRLLVFILLTVPLFACLVVFAIPSAIGKVCQKVCDFICDLGEWVEFRIKPW